MASIETEMQKVVSLVLANNDAIRLGNASGLTGITSISTLVRGVIGRPDPEVPKTFFSMVEAAIESYMMEHFGNPLIAAKQNGRELFAKAAEFNKILRSIESAVRFSFLSLDAIMKRNGIKKVCDVPFYSLTNTFDNIRPFLFKCLIERMDEMRDGDNVSRDAIGSVVEFIRKVNHQIDTQHKTTTSEEKFVEYYCISVREYYERRGAERLASAENIVAYANWAGRRINEERNLLSELAMGDKWESLKQSLTTALVRDNFVDVVQAKDGGLATQLDNERDVSDLFALLELVQSVNDPHEGVREVSKAYQSFANGRAVGILSAPEPPAEPVAEGQKPRPPRNWNAEVFKKMMEFMNRQLLTVWPNQFKSSGPVLTAFEKGITEAFKGFAFVPQCHSSYCDGFFRELKAADLSDEVQNNLTVLLKTFQCITARDEFIQNHKASLARRLLRPNFSREAEVNFIGRLKTIVGNAEMYSLTQMIQDIETSEKHVTTFNDTILDKSIKTKTRFIVYNRTNWPLLPAVPMQVPAAIDNLVKLYERYYGNKFSTRKIEWLPNHSSGAVTIMFPTGPKEFTGTLLQVSILLMLDGKKGTVAKTIGAALEVDERTVMDTIASMTLSKVNVVRHVDGKTFATTPKPVIRPDQSYGVNTDFKSALRKMDLATPATSKSSGSRPGGDSAQMDGIEGMRNMKTQISIVRYMKSRGRSRFDEMVTECIKNLQQWFEAQPNRIKMVLDDLIAKEFIKRSDEDRAVLEYIA